MAAPDSPLPPGPAPHVAFRGQQDTPKPPAPPAPRHRRRTPRSSDVLLFLPMGPHPCPPSGEPQKQEGPPRKRRRRGGQEEAEGGAMGPASGWGSRLPPEILVRIFGAVVEQDGAVPFLCRVARVCRLWAAAATAPQLWERLQLGGRWGGPPHGRHLPDSLEWGLGRLAESRLCFLQELVLCGGRSRVGTLLQTVGERCPRLRCLELQHCQFPRPAWGRFLAAAGARLRELRVSGGTRMGPVLAALAGGACPELRLLELDAEGAGPELAPPLERLQGACPRLEVLRLLNLNWAPPRRAPPSPPPPGFPQLRELGLAGGQGLGDPLLRHLLPAVPNLRRLDLRACPRITPGVLLELPCNDLEELHLGLPSGAEQRPRVPWGSAALARRWWHSLLELDLGGRGFPEPDLARAMATFGPRAPLRTLRLPATSITAPALSALLLSCPQLAFLDLSGCRRLPRGTKGPHCGRGAVCRCLRLLAGLDPEEETPHLETPDIKTPSKEIPNTETHKEKTPNEETPNMETPDMETPDLETPSKETPEEEAPDMETPGEDTPNPEISSLETPDQETPDPENLNEENPDLETPDKDTPSKEPLDEEPPSEGAPNEEPPDKTPNNPPLMRSPLMRTPPMTQPPVRSPPTRSLQGGIPQQDPNEPPLTRSPLMTSSQQEAPQQRATQ